MTIEQLESADDEISTDIQRLIQQRNALNEEINQLAETKLENSKRINEILREQLAGESK